MNIKQALASVTLVGTLAFVLPSAPAHANGAASTRNLILLGGAATYLILQHNRKVHERYAEDAQRQAALQQQNNDAWAAYRQEQRAYQEEAAVNGELKKEIAYQHNVVEKQRRQLASLNVRGTFMAQQHSVSNGDRQVAMVSYGWGEI